MENNTKNAISIFTMLGFLGATVSIAISVFLFQNNQKFQVEIGKRDNLIKFGSANDSLLALQTKNNAAVINRYVDSCEVIIEGKNYSTSDLINTIFDLKNKMQDEQINHANQMDSLKFELLNMQTLQNNARRKADFYEKLYDTTRIARNSEMSYKFYYDYLKDKYGISVEVVKRNDKNYLSVPVNRVDSALQIFPWVKNRASYDTVKKTWSLNITGLSN